MKLCDQRARKMTEHDEVVYYIRFGDRVKIGTTKNLEKRLIAIPHDEVLATEPGGLYVEQQRHKQFAHIRVHHEWFDLTPELSEHISAVRARATSAAPTAP
ncbi:GIY-YIG nuclease family protein [Nocardia sp. NPDC051463]|uniref:GIY-YIG nuclease family protein n=1 Tax=Nocardia sp. NPDC051463 TaxID=3154845 RepID=UPI00344B28EA